MGTGTAAPGGWAGREKGAEKGSGKEPQEDAENSVTEQPLGVTATLPAAIQLYDPDCVTVPTLQMRKTDSGRRGDLPRLECVRVESRIRRQGGQAAETPKPPPSPPFHAAGNLHPPGRGVHKSSSGRHCHLLPATPRSALGPYDPEACGTPASRLPSPLSPSPPAARAALSPSPGGRPAPGSFAAASPGAGGRGERLGGRGPWGAATRHSRVELVVHPLTAAVATASRSDFRFAVSPPP